MFFRSIAGGFRSVLRRPGLVLLLWAWHTVLALVVTAPAWSRIRAASELSPETDVLLRGIQLGTLIELLEREGAAFQTLIAATAALAVLALLSNAFVAGGILEVLLAGDARPLLHRFFRGAGHFFSRSLRLLAITLVVLVFAGGLVSAGLGAALRPVAQSGWEPAAFLGGLVTLAVIGLVVGLCVLALDYARVMLVAGDGRGMLRAWFVALRFVLAHPLSTGTMGFGFFGLVLAVVALGAWLPLQFGATGWVAITAAAIVQQVLVAAWIGVRVAQIAAQARFWQLATPPPAPVPGGDPLPSSTADTARAVEDLA